MSVVDDDINAVWSHETETLLSSWAEKASCFRWLHGRSEKRYRRRYYSFAVPTIVLSTLAGAAGFALDSYVPEGYKDGAQATIGAINIFAGCVEPGSAAPMVGGAVARPSSASATSRRGRACPPPCANSRRRAGRARRPSRGWAAACKWLIIRPNVARLRRPCSGSEPLARAAARSPGGLLPMLGPPGPRGPNARPHRPTQGSARAGRRCHSLKSPAAERWAVDSGRLERGRPERAGALSWGLGPTPTVARASARAPSA